MNSGWKKQIMKWSHFNTTCHLFSNYFAFFDKISMNIQRIEGKKRFWVTASYEDRQAQSANDLHRRAENSRRCAIAFAMLEISLGIFDKFQLIVIVFSVPWPWRMYYTNVKMGRRRRHGYNTYVSKQTAISPISFSNHLLSFCCHLTVILSLM